MNRSKRKRGSQLIVTGAVAAAETNKREPTKIVSSSLFHPVSLEIATFLLQESKATASNVLLEESQKYVIYNMLLIAGIVLDHSIMYRLLK